MSTDTEALLQDILARCAAEAAACLDERHSKDVTYRAIEVRMAASMAHASARLADSLARLKNRSSKRGSIGRSGRKPVPGGAGEGPSGATK